MRWLQQGSLCLMLLLMGCSQQSSEDVRAYVATIKRQPPGKIEPLPDFHGSRDDYRYSSANLRSPFQLTVREVVFEITEVPDRDRPRELLESYALDTLAMVGTISKKGVRWALIKDFNGLIHRVGVGNYIGLNSGLIQEITEEAVIIRTVVKDDGGNWIEKMSVLKLPVVEYQE